MRLLNQFLNWLKPPKDMPPPANPEARRRVVEKAQRTHIMVDESERRLRDLRFIRTELEVWRREQEQ